MTERDFAVGVKREIYHARLRQLRRDKGLSQEKLADLCNMTIVRFQTIETIKGFPHEREAFALADFFGLAPEDLFPQWSQPLYNKTRRMTDEVLTVSRVALTSGAVLNLEAPQTMETMAQEMDIKRAIRQALAFLSPREQKILRMRFGLDDGVTQTYENVGEEFGVTRERIRQIEAKAMERLKKNPEVNLAELIKPKPEVNVARQQAITTIMNRFAVTEPEATQILTYAEDRSLTLQTAYNDVTQTHKGAL